MAAIRTTTIPKVPDHGGGMFPPVRRDGGGDDDNGRPRRHKASDYACRLAVWALMVSMSLFFLPITYAYLVRHGLVSDWRTPALSAILTLNTCVLLASSFTLHLAYRNLVRGAIDSTLRDLTLTAALGIAFLFGQWTAWKQLFAAGVYIASFPNSGFFYLISAVHAIHLLGALGVLLWVLSRAWRGRLRQERPLPIELTSIFWHMLDFTWLYLYAVLVFWK